MYCACIECGGGVHIPDSSSSRNCIIMLNWKLPTTLTIVSSLLSNHHHLVITENLQLVLHFYHMQNMPVLLTPLDIQVALAINKTSKNTSEKKHRACCTLSIASFSCSVTCMWIAPGGPLGLPRGGTPIPGGRPPPPAGIPPKPCCCIACSGLFNNWRNASWFWLMIWSKWQASMLYLTIPLM